MNSLVQGVLRRIPRKLGDPRVFADCRKVSHRFPSWVKAAGLLDLHFHDLRHTFASRLVMAGVDIVTVKELMGHKTIAMTLRYAHLSPGHQRQAVERLVAGRSDTGSSTSPHTGQAAMRGQAQNGKLFPHVGGAEASRIPVGLPDFKSGVRL